MFSASTKQGAPVRHFPITRRSRCREEKTCEACSAARGTCEPGRLNGFRATRAHQILALLASFLAGFSMISRAEPLDPIDDLGLSVGDTYHWVFITSGTFTATDPDIGTYNAHVQSQAEQAGSVFLNDHFTWKAIASTATVDAKDNAPVGLNSPIYLPDGSLVATGFGDLWDGNLGHAININQNGTTLADASRVWTGTLPSGYGAGSTYLGSNPVIAGSGDSTDQTWVTLVGTSPGNMYHLYALSEELTVLARYACIGFEAPVDDPLSPVTIKKPNRALPFKAELVDQDGNKVTDSTISAPPVMQATYTAGVNGEPTDISADTVGVGLGTVGNQFVFTGDEKWQFNLKLGKNDAFSAPGTYRVTMAPGDGYEIQPTCEAKFVIE